MMGYKDLPEVKPSVLLAVLVVATIVDTEGVVQALLSRAGVWRVVFPYLNRNSACTKSDILFELHATLPRETFGALLRGLAPSFETAASMQQFIERVAARVTRGEVRVKTGSLVATALRELEMALRVLPLDELARVWSGTEVLYQGFLDRFPEFKEELLEDNVEDILVVGDMLRKAALPLTPASHSGTADSADIVPPWRDVTASQAFVHRQEDLQASGGASGPSGGATFIASRKFALGHIPAAFDALHQAFLWDRRGLVEGMRDSAPTERRQQLDDSVGAARALVADLNRLIEESNGADTRYSAETIGIPSTLAVRPADVRNYLIETADDDVEKVGALALGLHAAVLAHGGSYVGGSSAKDHNSFSGDNGLGRNQSNDSRPSADALFKQYRSLSGHLPLLLQSPDNAITALHVYKSFTTLWWVFGNSTLLRATCDLMARAVPDIPSAEARSWCATDVANTHAWMLDDPIEALAELSAIDRAHWPDSAQASQTLVLAELFTRAQDYVSAHAALSQLSGLSLDATQARAVKVSHIHLAIYESRFQTAFTLSENCVKESRAHNELYLELLYTVLGIRALVLTADPVRATKAYIRIRNTLPRALANRNSRIVLELIVLQARICINSGDYAAAETLCDSVQHLVYAAGTTTLICEWQLISATAIARTDEHSATVPFVDPQLLQSCLYVEFSSTVASTPEADGVCVKHKPVMHNPLSSLLKTDLCRTGSRQSIVSQLHGAYRALSLLQSNRNADHANIADELAEAYRGLPPSGFILPPMPPASPVATPILDTDMIPQLDPGDGEEDNDESAKMLAQKRARSVQSSPIAKITKRQTVD